MSRLLSVIIKPTLTCSMDCRHCYHPPTERAQGGRISFDRLDRLFSMISREYDAAWFIWHGGEPLILPLSFYKKVIELEEKHFGVASHRVGNTIQTNGLALNRKFLVFCRDKQINVGVSHEGPCDGLLRPDGAKVDKILRDMNRDERVFSVSATICRGSQSRQREIYEYFRDAGMTVSFSPVIAAGEAAVHPELVPDPEAYAAESNALFDEWLHDRDAQVPLLPHYLYLLSALGDPQPADCAHTSCLTKWLCVYPNGDLYPCAKACPAPYKLGNLDDFRHLGDVFRTPGFVKLLEGTVARREQCRTCPIFDYCAGGCSVDACYEGGIEKNGGNACRIYRTVFTHVKETVDGILRDRPDLQQYNSFVQDAVLGKLVNPLYGNGN
ncbi:MAG: radical SAM protein [Candidatus Methanomethylophilus sp.]|nr:radical SAM protein [Methanomethylophilus sp.]MDD3232907.1 radical SAM protein [Methanomethylophilus sp.]MDD4221820.1 radical SAM protein [Methanomethylophilus sp.]MDD4668494.1 radical SAM protein [Methanomethylophilus sp.]